MLSINISELIWTVINFFLLLFLLRHFLFKPLTRFMDERQGRIDAGLEAERRAKESLQETEEQLAALKADSRREAGRLVTRAEQEVEERSLAMRRQAKQDAAAARRTGREELALQREREAEELTAKTPELAALLAERLLG